MFGFNNPSTSHSQKLIVDCILCYAVLAFLLLASGLVLLLVTVVSLNIWVFLKIHTITSLQRSIFPPPSHLFTCLSILGIGNTTGPTCQEVIKPTACSMAKTPERDERLRALTLACAGVLSYQPYLDLSRRVVININTMRALRITL